MSNVGAFEEIREVEQAAIGPAKGMEWIAYHHLLVARKSRTEGDDLLGNHHKEQVSRDGVFLQYHERTYDRLFDDGEIDNEALFLREVEGVNHVQQYIVPTLENLQKVLAIVESQGLSAKGLELAKLKAILESDDDEAKVMLVASIQQIRIFDASQKVLTEGIDFHPITIDVKFKPESEGEMSRGEIKWRANENGDLKMLAAIGEMLETIPSDQVGEIERYFIAYEWLPEAVIKAFNLSVRLQGVSDKIFQKVFAVLRFHYAMKRDVRYDVVTSPSGKLGYMVTRETECSLAGNVVDQQAMIEEVAWLLEAVQTSLKVQGYQTFKPSELHAAKVALADDPSGFLETFLTEKTNPAEARRILEKMRKQVLAITELFDLEPQGQIVVKLKNKFEVLGRLTTLTDRPRSEAEEKGFVPDTREAVRAEIDAILASA